MDWREIENPVPTVSILPMKPFCSSSFFTSFVVRLCPLKNLVFDKLALLIDPLSKNFELTTDLTVDDSIALFGLDALVNYYGLLDPYNMHLNYVGENTFMYKLFSSEGLELTYDRLSSTSCHVLMDGVNCSEPKLDISENFLYLDSHFATKCLLRGQEEVLHIN
ncbi:hypothetical protein DEO72_LG11g2159 [Vigna unguiculata]|uniref:Uncharacterized protein n=1 Tax=Vigna unguiculata TaxID=3917 RepID=A0A4D6NMT8_VIGUN|nr:hypothetical protein DEO72_LG11g2159 [Vigna unguiculata]